MTYIPTTYDEIALIMHHHEWEFEHQIPRGQFIVVRLDGRNFSALTETHYDKPFDFDFHKAMVTTTQNLMTEFAALYAYVASDEISLLFTPSWDMFDRRIEKATTLMASSASVSFSLATGQPATFDARALAFESLPDVCCYFDWRLGDVERCALQTMTYWTLRNQGMTARQTAKMLDGLSVAEKRAILNTYGFAYGDLPAWARQGSGFHWETYEKDGYNPILQKTVMATRRRITHFDDFQSRQYYREWLASMFGTVGNPVNNQDKSGHFRDHSAIVPNTIE